MAITCLSTIIGLDKAACDCFPDEPEGYSTTGSGYYLTDPEYGVPLQNKILAAADCSQSAVWDVMARARTEAINDFLVDLKFALDQEKTPGFTPWRGVVGKASANRTKTVNNDWAGQVWQPATRKIDLKFVITAIYIGLDSTGTVDLKINSNKFGFSELSETLTTTSGQFVKNTLGTPITLELYDAAIPDLYYTFAYEHGGNAIRNNDTYCCGRPAWMQHVNVAGFDHTAKTKDYSGAVVRNTAANGLAFEGYIDCEHLGWVCNLDQLGGKEVKSLIGRAVLYKATVKTLSKLMESGKINQFTLLNAEESYGRIAHSNERYNELIAFMAGNAPDGLNGCYGCAKDAFGVGRILV